MGPESFSVCCSWAASPASSAAAIASSDAQAKRLLSNTVKQDRKPGLDCYTKPDGLLGDLVEVLDGGVYEHPACS
jgi:hypothetical protein